MNSTVTAGAKGDQIFLLIVSQMAPRLDVMNLKFFEAPASLTAPTIPYEHLAHESLIGLWLQPHPGLPGKG